jgi:hypothetical protein
MAVCALACPLLCITLTNPFQHPRQLSPKIATSLVETGENLRDASNTGSISSHVFEQGPGKASQPAPDFKPFALMKKGQKFMRHVSGNSPSPISYSICVGFLCVGWVPYISRGIRGCVRVPFSYTRVLHSVRYDGSTYSEVRLPGPKRRCDSLL